MRKKCMGCKRTFNVARNVKRCANCHGYLQSPILVDLVDNPTRVQGLEPEQVSEVLDADLGDDNEVFALLEINGRLEMVRFNNDGHAEENVADDLDQFFRALNARNGECLFNQIRIVIRFSPCLIVCAPKYVQLKALADGFGYHPTWIIDFANIYMGHEASLDLLVDAGFIVPNYVVVRSLCDARSSFVKMKQKMGVCRALVQQRDGAGLQTFLGMAKQDCLSAMRACDFAFDAAQDGDGLLLLDDLNTFSYCKAQASILFRRVLDTFVAPDGPNKVTDLENSIGQTLSGLDALIANMRAPRHRRVFLQ